MNFALYFASFFDASFIGDNGIFFSFSFVLVEVVRDPAEDAADEVADAVVGGAKLLLLFECLDVPGDANDEVIAFRAEVPTAIVNDFVRFFNDLVIFFL